MKRNMKFYSSIDIFEDRKTYTKLPSFIDIFEGMFPAISIIDDGKKRGILNVRIVISLTMGKSFREND